MTEIYHIQNEKQYKKLLIRLISERDYSPDEFEELNIYSCDYKKHHELDVLEWDDVCDNCNANECELIKHIEDKDVANHFDIIGQSDIDYPSILVLADTNDPHENITLISVREAKENTRYG